MQEPKRLNTIKLKWVAVVAVLILSACTRSDKKPAQQAVIIGVDTIQQNQYDTTEANFIDKDTLYKYFDTFKLNNTIYFLSQGDLLIEEKQFERLLLYELWESGLEKIKKIRHEKEQRLVITYDPIKKDTVKWEHFPIKYCIRQSTFAAYPGGYELVKANMNKAVADWAGVCKVRFEHVKSADAAKEVSSFNLDFVVEFFDPGRPSQNIAIAFYPNDDIHMRVLRILPFYFSVDRDKVGVIRHELGHILGFRHEHAAYLNLAPLECRQYYPESPAPSKPVTITYDMFSVMHYFCGNAGTKDLSFSKNDSLGFVTVYGKN